MRIYRYSGKFGGHLSELTGITAGREILAGEGEREVIVERYEERVGETGRVFRELCRSGRRFADHTIKLSGESYAFVAYNHLIV